MNTVLRALCAGAALAAVAIVPVALGGPAHAGQTTKANPLELSVLSVTPSAPELSHTPRPLIVGLRIRNTTAEALGNVQITAVRGDPLATQAALDAALAHSSTPKSPLRIPAKTPLTVNVPPGATIDTTFTTNTDIPKDAGICLCAKAAVYPLYFSAHRAGSSSGGSSSSRRDQALATAVTYLPSFYAKPAPVRVSWVWPLIDHPHRLTGESGFTDDVLAASVGVDGRLFRSLAVIEQLESRGSVPITLVVDPDLLDELAVMTGRYTVRAGGGTVPGTGQPAASAWLDRLAALLQTHSEVQVQLTPYADPDIQSLSERHLTWARSLPAAMRARVSAAMVRRPLTSTVSWPPSNAVSSGTLDTLAAAGVRTVVLDPASVTPRDGANGAAATGLARLSKHDRVLAGALTSPAVQRYAAAVLTRTTGNEPLPGTAQLPLLVAEVAIRAAQDPASEHTLVITPPRYVDPDPAAAVRAILDTSISPFAQPAPIGAATIGSRLPRLHSHPASSPGDGARLPSSIITAARNVTSALPKVSSLLNGGGPSADALVAALPVALQRTESAYWVSHSTQGKVVADALMGQVDALVGGVSIVRPSTGTYTLASSNSPLPITLQNKLGYRVQVRLSVSTVNQAPGFTTKDIGAQYIPAGDKRTLHLPTTIDRSGRIQIRAQLMTADNRPLGKPVPLSVHSTSLGVVGVVITIVAGAVLVLALLLRAMRRLRKRGRSRARACAGAAS